MSGEPFKVPNWASIPPPGLHLDVVKNGVVLQKLLLDEKSCYMFGRKECDFTLQHASCSRQHAALVYHKHLKRPFLIDLGSSHGTFVGTLRLEAHKPTQIPLDTTIRFGASTRSYTLRERPQVSMAIITDGEGGMLEEGEGGTLLGLPELDNEIDDLTQYNTAHNRQISIVGVQDTPKGRKRKSTSSISFAEEEEIINMEDVDPSVGRFRNMVSTTIIPKKQKLDSSGMKGAESSHAIPISPTSRYKQPLSSPSALYSDLPPPPGGATPLSPSSSLGGFPSSTGLFGRTISAAPPVANPMEHAAQSPAMRPAPVAPSSYPSPWEHAPPAVKIPSLFSEEAHPRKKKYAKEAWPGKKPPQHLLV